MRKLGRCLGALSLATLGSLSACSHDDQNGSPPGVKPGPVPTPSTAQVPVVPPPTQPPLPLDKVEQRAASKEPAAKSATQIAWAKTFEEAQEKASSAKKLIMVDFYTDW